MVTGRAGMLEGSLSEFDLESVIAVVSTSGRLTGVELSDERGSVIGTLFIKADQIVAARAGKHSGRDAIRRLLTVERPARFSAFRVSEAIDVAPLISVSDAFLALAPRTRAPRISTILAALCADDGLVAEDSDTDEELLVFAEIAEPGRPRRSK